MRVLHAADVRDAAPGALIPAISALARALIARGDAFAFVVPKVEGAAWYPQMRETGAELHVVDDAPSAARFARPWRPTVAHVHFSTWETPLTVALWGTRAQVFWHAHAMASSGGRVRPSPKSIAKYRIIGARVERFIAASQAIAEELTTLGAPRGRIVVIPTPIDTGRMRRPDPSERVVARARLGIGREPAVLFLGRAPDGVEAVAAALAQIPGVVVVAVDASQDARDALVRHARVIALESPPDVLPLLWACDALAMPSNAEGFARVLSEAALTGLPAVASDVPELRTTAGDRDTVRFAPPGDAPAFGNALREALYAPRTTPRAKDEARGLDRWVDQILELYPRA